MAGNLDVRRFRIWIAHVNRHRQNPSAGLPTTQSKRPGWAGMPSIVSKFPLSHQIATWETSLGGGRAADRWSDAGPGARTEERRGEHWQRLCRLAVSGPGPLQVGLPVPQHQVETDGATFGRATIDQHRGRDGSSGAGETFRTGRIWGVSAGLSETRHSKGVPRHEASQPIVLKSLQVPPQRCPELAVEACVIYGALHP